MGDLYLINMHLVIYEYIKYGSRFFVCHYFGEVIHMRLPICWNDKTMRDERVDQLDTKRTVLYSGIITSFS